MSYDTNRIRAHRRGFDLATVSWKEFRYPRPVTLTPRCLTQKLWRTAERLLTMQTTPLNPVCTVGGASRSLHRLFPFLVGLIAALFFQPVVHAAEVGVITGLVNNTATGNMLEGARVEIPSLNLTALTEAPAVIFFPACQPAPTR